MKKFLIMGLLPFVVGCAGIKTMSIDRSSLPGLQGRTLSVIIHESPDFMAMTFGKSMFNFGDVEAAFQKGKNLVSDNRIPDPASKISREMANFLRDKYGLKYNETSQIRAQFKNLDDMVMLANGRDYVLDVETVDWSFIYADYSRADYQVEYGVKLRLIDAGKAKSIIQGKCHYNTKSAGKPLVSYDALLADNAAYIKQALDDAATYCVGEFEKELSENNH